MDVRVASTADEHAEVADLVERALGVAARRGTGAPPDRVVTDVAARMVRYQVKYAIEFTRVIRMTSHAEVEATSKDDAIAKGLAIVDAPRSNEWIEGDIVDESTKVKVLK